MSTPAVSQTFVRGNSRIIFENGPQFLNVIEEKHRTLNSTHISWNWNHHTRDPIYKSVKKWELGFEMKSLQESMHLMQECINILEMQGLGSHDKIVHEFGGVNMKRTGSDPDVVQILSQKGNPVTGSPPINSDLRLSKSQCYQLIQKLKSHTPLLGN